MFPILSHRLESHTLSFFSLEFPFPVFLLFSFRVSPQSYAFNSSLPIASVFPSASTCFCPQYLPARCLTQMAKLSCSKIQAFTLKVNMKVLPHFFVCHFCKKNSLISQISEAISLLTSLTFSLRSFFLRSFSFLILSSFSSFHFLF